jgi:hypothetical protein
LLLFNFIFKDTITIRCVPSGEQIFPEPAGPPGGHFRQLLAKPNRGLGKGKAPVMLFDEEFRLIASCSKPLQNFVHN